MQRCTQLSTGPLQAVYFIIHFSIAMYSSTQAGKILEKVLAHYPGVPPLNTGVTVQSYVKPWEICKKKQPECNSGHQMPPIFRTM